PAHTESSPVDLKVWQWFLLAAAVPLIICALKLNLDLWHDEVYTIDSFVSRGVGYIVTDYHLPNNHVFYSLVIYPFYCLSDSNFVLRLPSLLCAAGCLWFIFLTARSLAGIAAGLLSVFVLGMTQMFLVHVMQIRGYGLSMFLCAWLAFLAL